MHFSDYVSGRYDVAQTDVGYVQGITTAPNDKARAILYLQVYNGTNSAASVAAFGVWAADGSNGPGTSSQITAAGQANPFYQGIIPTTQLSNPTGIIPDRLVPFHVKGNLTAPAIIIPPGFVFGLVITDVALNGSIVVEMITAEIQNAP